MEVQGPRWASGLSVLPDLAMRSMMSRRSIVKRRRRKPALPLTLPLAGIMLLFEALISLASSGYRKISNTSPLAY